MSKLDIGVGDEFPLDETAPDNQHRRGRHGHRWRHHHHRHHHGMHGHHHPRHGFLHLPLLIGVAVIAAMIGAGKIALPAIGLSLAIAAIALLLLGALRFFYHRRWHQGQKEAAQ